ncbi:pyridine nucleotide-disulfide oxidoreductase, partial [Staphylococcus aureus]
FIMHWTIIGGGRKGTAKPKKILSNGLKKDRLKNNEPHENFCQKVNSHKKRIEKTYFRSPILKHVQPQPFHLKQIAKKHQNT